MSFTFLNIDAENIPLLIEAEQLWSLLQQQDIQQKICLLDVSRATVYQQVHIPYAISISPKQLVQTKDMATGLLPEHQMLQKFIDDLAITPQHHVIVYDDEGGAWAGRVLWNLHCMGFYRVSVLNGGIHAWLASKLPVSNHIPTKPDIDKNQIFQIDTTKQPQHRILFDELNQLIGQSQAVQLWDCRSPAEFCGERLLSRRGGHLPHALNYEWTNAICRENHLKLHELSTIRQQLQRKGFDLNEPVIVYCQSHHRSGLAYLIAQLLGWSVRAYDGAWSEWGNRLDTVIVGAK